MAFSLEEKVDLLLKKIAFGKTKTDTSENVDGFGEAVASPLLLRADKVLKDSASIPTTPGAVANVVQAYQGTDVIECIAATGTTDTNVSGFKRAWQTVVNAGTDDTALRDWIPPEFGPAYTVEVYVGPTGWNGSDTPATTIGGTDGSGTGANVFRVVPGVETANWVYDYQAGVLYWTNENESGGTSNQVGGSTSLTTSISSSDVVYIKGYRYIGNFGVGGGGVSLGTNFDAFAGLSAQNVLEFDDQTARKVLAAPSDGNSGAVSFRALVAADIPVLNQDTTGTADLVTVTDSSANTAFPVVFHNGSNGLLDDTGTFTYNPTGSIVSATKFVGALQGNADTVTTNANLTGHITSNGNATTLNSFTVAQLNTALSDATLSGNNTGDQTITLQGDVTGTGTGTFTATIPDDTVTFAKMQDLTTANRLLGGTSAGTITEVQVATDMIADDAVTAAKLADAINTSISNNASAASAAQTTANAALPKSGGTMTGNITFAAGQPTGNSGLVPAAGTAGHFLKHDGTFGAVAYTNVSGTPSIGTIASQNSDGVDIDGGTIDGVTIATSDITVGAGKTLNVSAGTLTLANNQISGDKVEGGTIAATTITTLTSTTVKATTLQANDGTAAGSIADSTGVVTLASSVLTTADINAGTIDGTTIGATTPAAGSFTNVTITGDLTVVGTGTQISLAQENVLFADALLTLGNADDGTDTDYADAAALAAGTKLGIEAYKQNHDNTAHPSLIFDTTNGKKYWAIDNKDHAASAEQRIARIFKVQHTISTAEISAGFFTVTHNLNHEDLIVQVRDNSTDQEVIFFKYKTKTAQTIQIYVGSNFSNGDIVNVVVVG